MKRLGVVGVILALTIAMVTTQTVLADWYAGNSRTSAYGIEAAVNTPQSAPYLEEGGESSWVSTPDVDGNWIQTGWRYYRGYTAARRYVEKKVSGSTTIYYHGTQGWGTNSIYKLVHTSGKWQSYIDDYPWEFHDGISAPQEVFGWSEVHQSSNNELDTLFANVYYKSSSGWELFDQARWEEDYPYAVEKTQRWYYRCYGP